MDFDGDGVSSAYEFGRQGRPPPWTDYDKDDDGLIEVGDLDQLNALRWDLDGDGAPVSANANDYTTAFPKSAPDMGCPITATDSNDNDCTGYELDADLDFNTDTTGSSAAVVDSSDDYWNGGAGWTPLGDSGPNPFGATFEGNNHTISNLFINVTGSSGNYIGLFGQLGGGTVTRVHLVGAKVTGNNDVGALVGHITLGTVSHSSSGGTVSGAEKVGGLVGTINSASGVVEYSRSSATVEATGQQVGGLVGRNAGKLRVSYATGAVTGASSAGGLVGFTGGAIYASYATGAVAATATSNASAGGLIGSTEGNIHASYSTGATTSASGDAKGLVSSNSDAISFADSYWDVTTTSIADDNDVTTGVGKTTTELQSPTQTDGYAGIYATWDIDVDNADGDSDTTTKTDDPWDFGTASEYPALKADLDGDGTPSAYEFGRQGRSLRDYDDDNDNLIEVSTLAQLNALHWDLDGNGDSTHADYTGAFLNAAADMGCAATCTGYELADDLNFDTNGSGTANSGDTYWNTGAGWTPIGDHPNGDGTDGYAAVFEGNGHAISNLFINQPTVDRMGLFGTVGETGVLRNLALVDADVTGGQLVGTLAAYVWGTVKLSYATGSVSGEQRAGGLVGVIKPGSLVSQSYAAVSTSATGDSAERLGGLVGQSEGRVDTSYATGSVSGGQHAGGLARNRSSGGQLLHRAGARRRPHGRAGWRRSGQQGLNPGHGNQQLLGYPHQWHRRRRRCHHRRGQDHHRAPDAHRLRQRLEHLRQLEPGPGQRLQHQRRSLGLRHGPAVPGAEGGLGRHRRRHRRRVRLPGALGADLCRRQYDGRRGGGHSR